MYSACTLPVPCLFLTTFVLAFLQQQYDTTVVVRCLAAFRFPPFAFPSLVAVAVCSPLYIENIHTPERAHRGRARLDRG